MVTVFAYECRQQQQRRRQQPEESQGAAERRGGADLGPDNKRTEWKKCKQDAGPEVGQRRSLACRRQLRRRSLESVRLIGDRQDNRSRLKLEKQDQEAGGGGGDDDIEDDDKSEVSLHRAGRFSTRSPAGANLAPDQPNPPRPLISVAHSSTVALAAT